MQSTIKARSRALLDWCREGARTAVFLAPRWSGLHTDAATLAVIVVSSMIVSVIVQRLYIAGPATFYWQALATGWIGTAWAAWNCYLLRPAPASTGNRSAAPTAAHLLTMILAQAFVQGTGVAVFFVMLVRTGIYKEEITGTWLPWILWLAPTLWTILAQIFVLWRGGDKRRGAMVVAALTVVSSMVLYYYTGAPRFWHADKPRDAAQSEKYFHLTQQLMESQPKLLAQRLDEIKPHHDGDVNLYAITFAPYADEVFRRESDVVAQVMTRRFRAEGRVLQLVNNVATVDTWPWATTLNLQRAIRHFAEVMDRDNDILFIHLTSHGGRDGELSAYFWPVEVEKLHPLELKRWLDDAGIRNRIISVSACYSGSWIAPLADEDTLVMTAADAEHTSYGCGSKSEPTFFGRAMYDEQLRNNTLSFEDAYQAARKIIQQREIEAGKDDGFSNPQIRVGSKIRGRLLMLQENLRRADKP
jgi:TM2 domain-containing membrane protein YozV